MIDLRNKRYVILEVIPTNMDPAKGKVVQISALKINGIILEERFDYRLNKNKISTYDILKMIDYDNESFKYLEDSNEILKEFGVFAEGLPLLIIDNAYTRSYLSGFSNVKESIFSYLYMKMSDDVFDKLVKKYHLEPSNHLVDLLYEALIRELN